MRRIMKQPRASSQWKLPLWVPMRFVVVVVVGCGEVGEAAEKAMEQRERRRLWEWKVEANGSSRCLNPNPLLLSNPSMPI